MRVYFRRDEEKMSSALGSKFIIVIYLFLGQEKGQGISVYLSREKSFASGLAREEKALT